MKAEYVSNVSPMMKPLSVKKGVRTPQADNFTDNQHFKESVAIRWVDYLSLHGVSLDYWLAEHIWQHSKVVK